MPINVQNKTLIPIPPSGASLPSLFQAYLLHEGAGAAPKVAASRFFGPLGCPTDQLDEKTALHLSEISFAGRVSPSELRWRYTTYPLTLVNQIQSLDTWERTPSSSRPRAILPVDLPDLRRCPLCAEEDRTKYSYAYYRAVHQLQVVRICLKHAVPLEIGCANCGAGSGSTRWWERLADSPCFACGSSERPPLSERKGDGWLILDGVMRDAMTCQNMTSSEYLAGIMDRAERHSWMKRMKSRKFFLVRLFGFIPRVSISKKCPWQAIRSPDFQKVITRVEVRNDHARLFQVAFWRAAEAMSDREVVKWMSPLYRLTLGTGLQHLSRPGLI
ncbi:MAG: hypothetical protein EON56_01970 [Alphaproteobacteria bacterium]|nr:MAG: hypothetical protein EON56_01970 [Alphaproteobacteria bacterium]